MISMSGRLNQGPQARILTGRPAPLKLKLELETCLKELATLGRRFMGLKEFSAILGIGGSRDNAITWDAFKFRGRNLSF